MSLVKVKEVLREKAPYISFGVGIASGISAIVFTVRGTLKLRSVVDAYSDAKDEIMETFEAEVSTADGQEPPTEEELRAITKERDREIMNLKLKTAGRVGLLYLPAMGSIGLSWASFGFSVWDLRKSYLGTAAVLQSTIAASDAYRQRWIDEVGPDKERAVYLGLKPEKITVEETDPETGKVKKVKKEVLSGDISGDSKVRFAYPWKKFDPSDESGSTQHDDSPVLSYDTLLGVLKYQQRLLDRDKNAEKLPLVDLIRELGFKPGKNGTSEYEEHMAGWLPGDVISVGFKDGYGNTPAHTLTEEEYNYLAGKSSDVTLVFNCRSDILSPVAIRAAEDDVIAITFTPDPEIVDDILMNTEGGESDA